MSDLSAICVTCGKPEARHSQIGDNCPSEAGYGPLYLETSFARESNVQIAQEQPQQPKRCLGCNVRLNEECVPVLTDAGMLADDDQECAHCKADSIIRLAAKISEVTAEEVQRVLDMNRHFVN